MMGELAAVSKSVYLNPDDLLDEISSDTKLTITELRSEYDACASAVKQRYTDEELPYDAVFAVEDGSAFLLYSLVRRLRPEVILETGVANGHSSFFMLSALSMNEYGELHSVDVSSNVGKLIVPEQKSRWHLHLLDTSRLKKSFSDLMARLPNIDLMIHDSDHSYQWMRYELETALPKISEGGFLACDDAHICYGMLDFCLSNHLKPLLLLEKRKAFGVVPASSA
jgi:predicted O-methyltransferase YrrM